MKIDKELLSEKNYEGSRFIEITDPTILELREKLNELQQEANPFLVEMEEISPRMDPLYAKIGELQNEIKKLQEELTPIRDEYDVPLKKVEEIDQRASLIKEKIEPLVKEIVEDQLGEFETARHLVEHEGKIVVEVFDELEETIKKIRAKK